MISFCPLSERGRSGGSLLESLAKELETAILKNLGSLDDPLIRGFRLDVDLGLPHELF